MKISLNEIKKYVPIPEDISTSDLITLIGSRLVEIEEVIDLTPKYQGIYIVKVVSCEKIPDTHLSLCQIDAGGQRSDLAENGTIQVVCGAPNVHAGMLAVWLAPGTIVPQTYGNEDFRLGQRKLRGYVSNGMLAAVDELDLGTDHEGIVEIHPNLAKPGDNFAEVFELNDIILDVENKSLTHRPDCFGLIGFAREVAGILGLEFQEPTWPEIADVHDLPLSVKITDKELCPRYSCAVFECNLPTSEKTHYLTYYGDVFLAKAGMRSISPLVDLTNIIMLRTGQPLHAFDYDKLIAVGNTKSPQIIVRAAREGEELQLLDGKTIQCIPEDILITSNDVPVALAGAMGGKNTEIDASTKRVVLESATFSLYHLRKTQMAHGIFSEAITRFTKGQPAAMTLPVLAETVAELGKSATLLAVADEWVADQTENVVKITTSEINNLLGTSYSVDTIVKTLENVGFTVKITSEIPSEASKSPSPAVSAESAVPAHSKPKTSQEVNSSLPAQNASLTVTAPVWRTDIHIKEDIIEEVGRLLGYDNIPQSLPRGEFKGTEIAPLVALKSQLRHILSDRLAMNELLTYSFVSKSLLEKVGQAVDQSYEIVNSISPELQCFRQQIVPSLLDKVRENIKSGHKHFTIYELNQVTRRALGLDADGAPVVQTDLGIVSLGDFYSLKALIFAALERGLKIDIEYTAITPNSDTAKHYPYLEPLRSAELLVGQQSIGAFGEVKASVLRKFKLEPTISACEISLDQIVGLQPSIAVDVQLSKFPSVERDITFKVAPDLPFGRVSNVVYAALAAQDLIFQVQPLSIYQPDPESKSFSFRLKFSSPAHTLDSTAISAIMEKITIDAAQIGAIVA